MTLIEEITQQPAVLSQLLSSGRRSIQQIAQTIQQRQIDYIYLAARGTSEHAGIYGQYLFGSVQRIPVALGAPSLFSVYHTPPRLERALVIGVSQSGQSPDILAVVEEGQRQGALTLAITNNPESPLANAANLVIDIMAGPERAVAATKSYTAQLMAFAMLSAHLANDPQMLAALEAVPEQVAQALALEPQLEALANRFVAAQQAVTLGRGFHFATAMEWALKLKEMTYVMADRYSTAEFRHGPIAVVEPGFPVFVAISRDPGLPGAVELTKQLTEQYQAHTVVVSEDEAALQAGQSAVRVPDGLPAWLMPLVSIIPAQLFCLHLAQRRGINPAAPRGLSKITLTH